MRPPLRDTSRVKPKRASRWDSDDDADGSDGSRRRLTDGASAGYGAHLFVCRFGTGAGSPKTEATRVTDTVTKCRTPNPNPNPSPNPIPNPNQVAKCRTPSLPPGNVPVFLSLNGQDFTKVAPNPNPS